MTSLPLAQPAAAKPCPQPVCAWTHHGYKHTFKRTTRRRDTIEGPAMYLIDINQQRSMEDATAASPTWRRGARPGKTEYLRDIGIVIGWDRGNDATFSFVECTGTGNLRGYHGRPMRPNNPKVGQMK